MPCCCASLVKALFVTAAMLGAITTHAQTLKPSVTCKTEIRERSGSLEASGRCHSQNGDWACFQDVVERCSEAPSGTLTHREFRHWTGTCAPALSDCWKANGRSLETDGTVLPSSRKVSETISAATQAATVLTPAVAQNTGWVCDDFELEKSSRLDVEHGVCGRTGVTAVAAPWACYGEVERRCRERYSGKQRTTREKRFLGCVESFSDCR